MNHAAGPRRDQGEARCRRRARLRGARPRRVGGRRRRAKAATSAGSPRASSTKLDRRDLRGADRQDVGGRRPIADDGQYLFQVKAEEERDAEGRQLDDDPVAACSPTGTSRRRTPSAIERDEPSIAGAGRLGDARCWTRSSPRRDCGSGLDPAAGLQVIASETARSGRRSSRRGRSSSCPLAVLRAGAPHRRPPRATGRRRPRCRAGTVRAAGRPLDCPDARPIRPSIRSAGSERRRRPRSAT